MSDTRRFTLAAVAILVLAATVRVAGIEARPFHHDEAINSIQVELLWKRGQYRYSPTALHGPTLAYLSLPFAWASPAESYASTTEQTWRAVPLLFSLALLFLTLALAPGIGRGAALAAAALGAVSPAMVFYSRYFIHEGLLATFGLLGIVCGWQALRRIGEGGSAWGWALGAGAALGLVHATKETFVITLAAAGVGFLASVARPPWKRPKAALLWHALAALAAATAVSVVFFSSFFTHAQGPLDSILTFSSYLEQGTDASSVHHHPWSWYLSLLLHHERGGITFTSEAVLGALSLVGFTAGISGRGIKPAHRPLARFFAVYTAAMLVIYSAIPYKTPWCLLGVLQGMTVLGGIAVVVLVRAARSRAMRTALVVTLLAAGAHLAWQGWLVNFRHGANERNPWVYSHSLSGVRDVAARVRALSPSSMHVYNWTDNAALYFYLRGVKGVRFHRSEEVAAAGDVDAILVAESQSGALPTRLAESYRAERFQLRPNIWATLYVRPELTTGTPQP